MKKNKVLVFAWTIFIFLFFTTACTPANKQIRNENVGNSNVNSTDSDFESFDFGEPIIMASNPNPAQNRNENNQDSPYLLLWVGI